MNLERKESERVLGALGLLLAIAIVSAALVTPPIYVLLSMIMGESIWPYSRVFNRVILVSFLVTAYCLRGRLQLSQVRKDFSLAVLKENRKQALLFVLVSFLPSFLLVWFFYLDGTFQLSDRSPWYYTRKLIETPIAAIIIGVLEEFVFRYLLFRVLTYRMGWVLAACLSSAIYSALHFIKPAKQFVLSSWNPLEGLYYIGIVVQRVLDDGFIFGFIGLFLVGMALCLAYHRSGKIWYAITLHAGWVLALKFQAFAFRAAEGVVFPDALGRRYFVIGEPLGWIAISLSLITVVVLTRQSKSPT